MKKTNYHTHTYRCGHAIGNEEDMVRAAINKEYDILGFSEHVPYPKYRKHILKNLPKTFLDPHSFVTATHQFICDGPNMRMPYKTKNDHEDKVKELKEKYKNKIDIYQGYECEYFEEYLPYFQHLLDTNEVDYLILGNHFDKCNLANKYYGHEGLSNKEIDDYVEDIHNAFRTHLFSYLAHPDLFLLGRDKIDDYCIQAMDKICKLSLEYDVPLELNAGGIRRGVRNKEGMITYPYTSHIMFRLAGNYQNKVIIGIDAHNPKDFNDTDYRVLLNYIKKYNLNLVDEIKHKKGNK